MNFVVLCDCALWWVDVWHEFYHSPGTSWPRDNVVRPAFSGSLVTIICSCWKKFALIVVPTFFPNASVFPEIIKALKGDLTWLASCEFCMWPFRGRRPSLTTVIILHRHCTSILRGKVWGLTEQSNGCRVYSFLRACEYFALKSIPKLIDHPQSVDEEKN